MPMMGAAVSDTPQPLAALIQATAGAGVGPAVFTSAAVGVGTVAAASVGFTVIYEAIFNMPGGTYVSAATMAAALGGIMGSGSGAVGIIAQNFLEPYLATGVDPAALAKIIATHGGSPSLGCAAPAAHLPTTHHSRKRHASCGTTETARHVGHDRRCAA